MQYISLLLNHVKLIPRGVFLCVYICEHGCLKRLTVGHSRDNDLVKGHKEFFKYYLLTYSMVQSPS